MEKFIKCRAAEAEIIRVRLEALGISVTIESDHAPQARRSISAKSWTLVRIAESDWQKAYRAIGRAV